MSGDKITSLRPVQDGRLPYISVHFRGVDVAIMYENYYFLSMGFIFYITTVPVML